MKLLVAEDDKDLNDAVCAALKAEGYVIESCFDGEAALMMASMYSYDLLVFDRLMPGYDGAAVLTELRKKGVMTPAILVTALDGIEDRIEGLDSGADDYLVKPFAMSELMARVRALMRRPRAVELDNTCHFLNTRLDSSGLTLSSDVSTISLSKRETALLEFLIRNHDITLSREQIITRVWGSEAEIDEGNLDNYIFFVRRRLKAVNSEAVIKTVHKMGYCMVSGGKSV